MSSKLDRDPRVIGYMDGCEFLRGNYWGTIHDREAAYLLIKTLFKLEIL